MIDFIKRKYISLASDPRFSEIFTGSIWAFSARVIAAVLGLAFSIIVARLYGARMVGIVAVIDSFLMLTTIFTAMGTSTSILRLIPEHLSRYSPTSAFKVYRKTHSMVVVVSVIMAVVFFFGANLIAGKVFSKPYLSYYFAVASVFVIFRSMMNLNIQAVRGLRLIRFFALMQFLPQLCNLLFLIITGLLWSSENVPVYALLFGFAATGVVGWNIVNYTFKKRERSNDTVNTVSRRAILSISLPMLLTTTMAFIIGQTGILMLGMFRTEAEVGYYAIAFKLASSAQFIHIAVASMGGPKFSELFHLGKIDELFFIARKSAKMVFFATTPILIGLILLGRPILKLVFGVQFEVAYLPLVILVIGMFINSISGATGMFMNMTDKETVLGKIMIMAAGLNIAINFLLIPVWGIMGTAIAAMVTTCFHNLVILFYMKVKFGRTTGYVPFSKAVYHTFRNVR